MKKFSGFPPCRATFGVQKQHFVKKEPFSITVNDQYTLDVHPEEAQNLDVVPNGPNAVHLLENGKAYQVELLDADHSTRTYTFRINVAKYTVAISDYY